MVVAPLRPAEVRSLVSAVFDLGLRQSSPKVLMGVMANAKHPAASQVTEPTLQSLPPRKRWAPGIPSRVLRLGLVPGDMLCHLSSPPPPPLLMVRPQLTTEHIKSHLQKFRLHAERSKAEVRRGGLFRVKDWLALMRRNKREGVALRVTWALPALALSCSSPNSSHNSWSRCTSPWRTRAHWTASLLTSVGLLHTTHASPSTHTPPTSTSFCG